uniref:Uncharacterized protein n=1 Tax=Aegilops tauschii subsp. strangulata TaxID=200361 RepID=A0A453ITH9_AEGTS
MADGGGLMAENVGNVHRVSVDGGRPRPVGVARGLDALPRRAVALEPGPEADHPHAVALAHAALGLDVAQLVPQRAARRVPELVQRHPRRLHLLVGQPEVLLQLVDDRAAAGVDAEVLERRAEVGDVRLHPPVDHLPRDEGEGELELLAGRQDERPHRGDIGLERVAGDVHQVLAEVDPAVALAVLLLEHAPVRAVLRAGERAYEVLQAEPGLRRGRRQQRGRAADAEEAVGQEHCALGAEVVVGRDGLRGDDQRVRAVGGHLQQVPREPHGDEPRAAPHAGEVHAADVAPQLVLVHDHVDQGRRGAEQAAVDDEYVDGLGGDAGLGEQVVDGREGDELELGAGGVDGAVLVRADVVVRRRQAGLLPEPRALQQARHEPDAALVELGQQLGVLQEAGEGDAAGVRGAEAGVVDEVHRAGTQHEIQDGSRGRKEAGQEEVHRPDLGEPAGQLLRPDAHHRDEGGGSGERDGDDGRAHAARSYSQLGECSAKHGYFWCVC